MQLKVSKSPGIDGISAEVYQHEGEAVLDKLQVETRTLPQDLRDAIILSLYKNQERNIRLFKLLRRHPTLHCRQNLGSCLAE